MTVIRVQEAASRRLDEIDRYTLEQFGAVQAERYIEGLFEAFGKIATHGVLSRPVPADFGVDGFSFRYQSHVVYWRRLANGDTGIVTILHQRMHRIDRFREDFGL